MLKDKAFVEKFLQAYISYDGRNFPTNNAVFKQNKWPYHKMGVPRAHSTKAQVGKRRSHLKLKNLALTICDNCKKSSLPHMTCKYCGFYDGKEVVNVLAKELKGKEKKTAKRS